MSGIMKLRLAVTILFIMMAISIATSLYMVGIETEADEEFYSGLNSDEIDEISRIFSKYPETNIESGYLFAGYIVWAVALGLFILMIKVWQTPSI